MTELVDVADWDRVLLSTETTTDEPWKRNTPGSKPGALRAGVLVSVAVVVTGVLVLLGRLFHDRCLGGEHHPRHRSCIEHR
jgi:hypothetical protein